MIATSVASLLVGALLMLWYILLTLGRQSDRDAARRATLRRGILKALGPEQT